MRHRQLDYQPDALKLFSPLLNLPRPVLLHSADRGSRFGRFDICAAEPSVAVTYDAGIFSFGTERIRTANPLVELRRLLQVQTDKRGDSPFQSGFLGYLGYELHQRLERQSTAPENPSAVPALWGGLYEWSLVTDHRRRTTTLHSPDVETERHVLGRLALTARQSESTAVSPFITSLTTEAYKRAFAAVMEYIRAGDCYQVNLAQHFQARLQGHPFDLYRQWLRQQPAPFCAYLGLAADAAVISFSPERFLALRNGRASVSPIKGTRARRQRPAADALARLDLLQSNKDRAENLMIVDLLRNDLGRVCVPGSVAVSHLFEPVSFHNVHHLVSTIEGNLSDQRDVVDLIAALFPCGSVTGAPKIRAIDIINELEPVGRSVYCGAIGYIDREGAADFSVAIRTAVTQGHELHLWGGGGLVADSKADRELEEIREKIGRLLATGGINE
ncbi:MAG: aminodeoxychorismate synthase component I [Pseudomonadales bacterium]